jgi:hypothetical protein
LGPFPEGEAEVVGEISYANPVDTGKMESVRFVCFVGFEGPLLTARVGSSFEYNVKLDITGLDVVGQHYERRIQLSQALKPHDFDRFTIRIAANKSSIHRFRLRLLYDNRFAIDSPPIELDLFMPRGSESFLRKVKGE